MKMNASRVIVLCAIMAGWLAASAQQAPVMKQELVQANNRFGFSLFSKLTDEQPGENVFISPASVSMCLAMAWNGASGTTRSAMARALALSGLTPDQANRANAALMKDLLSADPKIQLKIANSLWAKKGIQFQPPFISANQQFYKARVTALDFGSPDAAQTINGWVSENTNGLIKSIVDRINPLDILFLVNAIYFKGTWTEQFDKAMTHDQNFYLSADNAVSRKMMAQEGKYSYFADKGFQAVSLPYGSGRLSMYLFVPEDKDGLDAFLAQLTQENWDKWLARFYRMSGNVVLPRFKLEYETGLNDALSALGMAEAFAPGKADFSKMVKTTVPVYISEVKHKTFVEVNEEGTEAAAVTSTRITMTSMPSPHERFSIVADHPFFVAIRDNTSGAILFTGAITDPKQ